MDYSRLGIPNIKEQLRALEKRRGTDPDIPVGLIDGPRFYVAYRWEESTKRRAGRWILLGFVRTRRLQFPVLRTIRKNFEVTEHDVMKLLDLFLAAKQGGPGEPPSQYNPIVKRKWLNASLRGAS